ncbi:MAG: hypothetical protein U1E06_16125, partial [Tabrizicola sp.]|nr:hypothetical protein [Tabrizicola sp.]
MTAPDLHPHTDRPRPASVTPMSLQGGVPPAQRAWRLKSFARDRAALAAAIFLVVIAVAVVFAPVLSAYTPDE